jgi:hypothetical protein
MAQNPLDDGGLLDQGDEPQPPVAPGTGQHVEPERALHQRRPQPPARTPACGVRRLPRLTVGARRRLMAAPAVW